MSVENPFVAVSNDPIKQNLCYIRQCEKGFSLFDKITLEQTVRVGVANPMSNYYEVEGQLEDLSMYEAVIAGRTIPVHQINRVMLLEEQNPFM